MTVHIPDELVIRFKKQFPELNLAEVVRQIIINKIEELKKLDELKSKGVI